MGYYSERLRQRLENMTLEEKKALWDKYSYLNEYGPIVNSFTGNPPLERKVISI